MLGRKPATRSPGPTPAAASAAAAAAPPRVQLAAAQLAALAALAAEDQRRRRRSRAAQQVLGEVEARLRKPARARHGRPASSERAVAGARRRRRQRSPTPRPRTPRAARPTSARAHRQSARSSRSVRARAAAKAVDLRMRRPFAPGCQRTSHRRALHRPQSACAGRTAPRHLAEAHAVAVALAPAGHDDRVAVLQEAALGARRAA